MPVATAADVVCMKILAGRPKDEEDVRAILEAQGPAFDFRAAEETLELLEGALDRRDLKPVLDRLRSIRSRDS